VPTGCCSTPATRWVGKKRALKQAEKQITSPFTEYQLQSAMPAVNFRTIGGVLDFYIMLGPSPEEVTKQYLNLIGKPFLPPYWSLGFQLSRWGYDNFDTMKAALDRTIECGFPLVRFLTPLVGNYLSRANYNR
jgi:alpha-glucosidase (family GH31 glycosyl hydrolase)